MPKFMVPLEIEVEATDEDDAYAIVNGNLEAGIHYHNTEHPEGASIEFGQWFFGDAYRGHIEGDMAVDPKIIRDSEGR